MSVKVKEQVNRHSLDEIKEIVFTHSPRLHWSRIPGSSYRIHVERDLGYYNNR